MTENQLSQLLDVSGDYCFLRCFYNYETPNSVSCLYHADECDTDFIVTVLDNADFARIYFYDSGLKKNFFIKNKDGKIDYVYSSMYLRKDSKAVLDISIRNIYLSVKRILSIYEDDLPF